MFHLACFALKHLLGIASWLPCLVAFSLPFGERVAWVERGFPEKLDCPSASDSNPVGIVVENGWRASPHGGKFDRSCLGPSLLA